MTIPCNTKDLENLKFIEKPNGQVAVRVYSVGGDLLTGVEWDAISVAYPNTVTEVFSYYSGGLAGTLVATVTVVYTNSSKDNISTVERV